MKNGLIMSSIVSFILSACSLKSEEIKLDNIWNFKITVKENHDNRQVELTGLLNNSSMGISNMKTNINNDELNITLYQKLAGNKYSGQLKKEITIGKNINMITYGLERKIIWKNNN
ncbi:hypothetical protein [Neisseria zalophi]|uniref:Lipoprotein n=1 Tax=Neisseria zalophi TaxID=640030 RepID=A0A5J6PV92_9NEIS|nr:hypothetical protein [Neisseria zalophi]QEY26196.1 hypothetical protein D0T92_06445 [Neisseria zalophi]